MTATPAKSLVGCQAVFMSAGVVTCDRVASTSVWPSGSDFATASVPRLPLAPGRASTSTGWPRPAASFSFSVRAIRSTMPPAGNGTMMRSGLEGNVCALEPAANRIKQTAKAIPFTLAEPAHVRVRQDRGAQAAHAAQPAFAVRGLALFVFGDLGMRQDEEALGFDRLHDAP